MKLFIQSTERRENPTSIEGRFWSYLLNPGVAFTLGTVSFLSILLSNWTLVGQLAIVMAASFYLGAKWWDNQVNSTDHPEIHQSE